MKRFGTVVLALVVAGFVAALVFATLGTFVLELLVKHAKPGDVTSPQLLNFIGMFIMAGAGSAVTVLVFLVAVIAGEIMRIRRWLYYVLAGIIACCAIPVLAAMSVGRYLPTPGQLIVFGCAGIAGGITYWLISRERV